MAIYHFDSQVISRGKGRSAIAASAYRSATKLLDQANDKVYNYLNKAGDVFYNEVMLPKGAPEWMADREKLWNCVEQNEKRKDAQLAREITLALPKDLSKEQNIELAKEFIAKQFVAKGMIADVCCHKGHGDDQPHVHVMLTMRGLNSTAIGDCGVASVLKPSCISNTVGFSAPHAPNTHAIAANFDECVEKPIFGMKVVEWNKKPLLYEWRSEWANAINKHLALAGLDLQVDHRSNLERGIDLKPQNKIGPVDGRIRYSDKVLEHEEIARSNGEKIYEDPSVAIKALTAQQSTFTHEDIARFVNTHTADREQFQIVYQKVKSWDGLVKLGLDDKNRERFTSQEMLELEYRMVKQSEVLSDKCDQQVDFDFREEVAKAYHLTENQAEAFRHITGDRDIACVVGYAGSGKSYMLRGAREVWEDAGYRVIGMTLSGIAAENLEGASQIKSYTVANRKVNWDFDRERLTSQDVVVVDEAGMLGSRVLARIMDEAVLAGSKVVLVGDPEQLQAIAAGAPFRGIVDRVGFAELNEIKRQKEGWQREATKSLALCRTSDAIIEYQKNDMVHEFITNKSAIESMVRDWHELSLEHNDKTSIMLAFRRNEVRELNMMARDLKKHYGELVGGMEFKTSRGVREFAIRDKVYFLENNKELGVKNGTLGTVQALNNNRFEVVLSSGKEIAFDIREYDAIDHGYATTIHKAQGITVDRTFVLASELFNRHVAYVALSRHREVVDLYWSRDKFKSFDNLLQVFSREKLKDLSLDYLEKDYMHYCNIFALNRGIESVPLALSIKQSIEAMGDITRNTEISEFAKLLKEEFKSDIIRYDAEHLDVATYVGKIDLSGKSMAILSKGRIKNYVLENVNTEAVEVGDKVRILTTLNEHGGKAIRLVKEDSMTLKEIVAAMNEYEREEANLCINSIDRKLSSKENYSLTNKLSTKEIYQALYERIPEILPEFGFVRRGNGYVATTGQKVDGSCGQKGKVYIYANNPGILVDYTRGNISIWEYISKNEGISDKKELFNYLASAAGLKPYFEEQFRVLEARQAPIPGQEQAAVSNVSSELWDKVHQYSLDKIAVNNNQVMKYLLDERGYGAEEVAKMGVGYIPNKKDLGKYLTGVGVNSDQIKEINKALGVIGYTHKLVVPYRDERGEIIGFAARNIKYGSDDKPIQKLGKYMYSKGLARSSTVFGIHDYDKEKPLIVVEGIFDALNAKAKGIENVVALGGAGINIRQLELFDRLGIKEVRLCLDNDMAGIKAMETIAIQIDAHNPDIKIKTLSLPQNVKDLDQLIKEHGKVVAEDVINKAEKLDTSWIKHEREMSLHQRLQKEGEGFELEMRMKM